MSTISERYKTLGELRAQLQIRLGFISQGPGSSNNKSVMNSFLQEGHDLICSEVDVKTMRRRAVLALSKGSSHYDWHNDALDEDIDPTRISDMWIMTSDQNRAELIQGITEAHRANTIQTYPTRWDDSDGQIELWPTPEQPYSLVVVYTAPQNRFEQDSDRPSVPDRLVFAYALSMAKAHYRHPDAQAYGTLFERQLRKYKADQHENKRYFMTKAAPAEPQVVQTATGYSLRVS